MITCGHRIGRCLWFAFGLFGVGPVVLNQHLVRVGVLGQVGRFAAVEAVRFARGTRVVCRTRRGLEIGEVLAPVASDGGGRPDGSLLRRMTSEDELLAARLEKHKHEAYASCVSLLAGRGISATLMEVEPLFDGRSLYFHFLGGITPDLESVIEQLAETYESEARIREFAATLTAGCGPDCGTEDSAGCGSGCSTCAIAGACKAGV